MTTNDSQPSKPTYRDDPHLLDYLTLWVRHRKQALIITLITAALFLGYTFMMPFTFKSMAVIMPPEKEKVGGIMSFLSGSGALDLLKGQENPALDMFKNVIDSRTVSEQLAKDERIRRYYITFDTAEREIAYNIQQSLTSEPLRNGVMNVEVTVETHWFPSSDEKDSARFLTSYLANAFVRELDRYNRERLVTSARNMREFTEREYLKRMALLDTAYMNLQNFQQQYKAISLTDQLQATVASAAQLAAQVQQIEIQLGVEERELTPNAARVEMLRAQLEEAKRQLARYDDGSIGEFAIALDKAPELIQKLAKLTREVKLSETITAYLRQQLEQEKLNEQRNIPTFTVLDSAIVPKKKASPKRSVYLILGLFVGIVISGIYVGIIKYRLSIQMHPDEHRKFLTFRSALKHRE